MKRSFKLLSLLLAAMLLFAGCAAPAEENDGGSSAPEETPASSPETTPGEEAAQTPSSADVLVVGGGMAGLTAAVKASQLGATVILFEQTDHTGGSSLYSSDGFINGACTQMQADAGIEDSPELFYEDFVRLGGEENLNSSLAMEYARLSGAAVDWLEEDIGVDFGDRVPNKGAYEPLNVARVYLPVGGAPAVDAKLLERLESYVDEGTATILYNTLVTELITDESGAVVGVKATGEDGTVKEYSAPATILATGGYGYSEELLKEYNFTNVLSSSPVTAIGSGYTLALSVGGQLMNMDYCAPYAGGIPTGTFAVSAMASTQYPGAIWVDVDGNRLADEMGADTRVLAETWTNAKDNIVYVLYDEAMIESDYGVITNISGTVGEKEDNKARLDELLSDGMSVYHADSIEGLAEQMGVDPDALAATIETYNGYCDAGEDAEFGRTESLIKFESGSYYAICTYPYVLMTSGGVVIDGDAQVLDANGAAIPGLYAAGELVGSANIGGRATIGGIGHGMCLTFGIEAATNAVARAGK